MDGCCPDKNRTGRKMQDLIVLGGPRKGKTHKSEILVLPIKCEND